MRVLQVIGRSGLAVGAKVAAALALAGLAGAGSTRADEVEYSIYHVSDRSKASVSGSSFALAKTLFQKTLILLDIELDQVTVPPLDVVTGASRPQRQFKSEFHKNRGQIIGGLEQRLGDNTKVGGSYYFSQESDYSSQSFVGTLSQEFFQKNFTLSLRAQYTIDSVGEILADGDLLNRYKETHQLSLVASQLLSPTTILHVGADAMRPHGFLSDPYRKGTRTNPTNPALIDTVTDVLPSMRYRQAVWAEGRQFLRAMDASLFVNYRYYWDDWNLTSHTLQLTFNKYVTPDWVLSPEYRYYIQTAADFGDYNGGAPAGGFFTTDKKLMAFESHMAGLAATFFLRALAGKSADWDFLRNGSVSAHYFHYFLGGANEFDNVNVSSNLPADVWEASIKFLF